MAEKEVSLYCGTNIFYESISFLDFPDLQIAENSGQTNKKYDIIFMVCTPWEISPIYVENDKHTGDRRTLRSYGLARVGGFNAHLATDFFWTEFADDAR